MANSIEQYTMHAEQCLKQRKYGKAYAFYLLIFKLRPDLKYSLEEEFCEAWDEWSMKLLSMNKFAELMKLYENGYDCFPECERFHLAMAKCFYQAGRHIAAHGIYKHVLKINAGNMIARECLDNLCRSIIDNWHYEMLNDKERNSKFRSAVMDYVIEESGKKPTGKVNVIDIGSGTGIMSIFAAKNNSVDVVACESCPTMAELGQNIIQINGLEENICTYNCMSTELSIGKHDTSKSLKHRAVLAISEIIDAGVFGERVVTTLDHAWKELLVSPDGGGAVIPSKAVIKATFIESEEIHKHHCAQISTEASSFLFTSNVGLEVDDKGSQDHYYSLTSSFEPYTCERVGNIGHAMLADYKEVMEVNFNDPQQISQLAHSHRVPFSIEMKSTKSGMLDAVILSFELALDGNNPPKYVLKSDIGSPCCWEQCVYPIRHVKCIGGKYEFTRIFVEKNSSVILNFLQCPDKVILDSCIVWKEFGKTDAYPQLHPFQNIVSMEKLIVLLVGEQEIAKINDNQFCETLHNLIPRMRLRKNNSPVSTTVMVSENSHAREHTISVLDISQSPLLGISVAANFQDVSVHRRLQNERSHVVAIDGKTTLSLSNYNVFEQQNNVKYDAAILDVVEPSGLLSECVFNDITKARVCIQNGEIFPSKVRVMAMVIESEELARRCTVSPDSTVGIDIAGRLNEFRLTTLSDINIHKVSYKCLSSPVLCEEIDMKHYKASEFSCSWANVQVMVETGAAHGVLLWYILLADGDEIFNSLHPGNSWQQCVLMQDPSTVDVMEQKLLTLNYRRRLSYISIEFGITSDTV